MASGDVVGLIQEVLFPGANPATPDVRAGGSTPAESIRVWDFDAGTDEYIDLLVYLSGYGGGGLTVNLVWMASSATSGNVIWQVAVRRVQDDAEDVDTSHTYAYNNVTAGAPSASGEFGYDNVTFTDGADMDSWANNEVAIVRVSRDADNASDTMTGDAELVAVRITET